MKKIFLTCFILTSLVACERSEDWQQSGEFFFLKSEEAVMPVWVTGNVSSGTFLITNHGGPGYASGLGFHATTSFKRLEEEYAIVYWDQRMSGNSQGDPVMGDLTIAQHVEDLEKLVTIIQDQYQPQSLFMYGHSWGGGLSILYMGKEGNQDDFKGWIDEDGSLQDKYEMDLKREWQIPRAEAKLAETGDESWQEIIDWWAENPNPDEGDWEPYQFVGRLGGYVYDLEKAQELNPSSELEKHFASPFQTLSWTDDYPYTNFMAAYDFMPSAQNITIPSLLIWGKEDGAVPYQLSDSLYQLLQTPEADKYKIQLEECGHSVHWEKPDEFYDAIADFIEKYK